MIEKTVIKASQEIAQKDLDACRTRDGIVAGPHHFVDLWARDSLFATYGLFKRKDFAMFRTTIDTFLAFQRKDGLVPYRVMRSHSTVSKYFGKPSYRKKLVANFRSHMSLGIVPDGGLMTVIASAEYVSRSKEYVWVRSVYASLVRSMLWYHNHFGNGLVSEWFQCEWADGVLKSGHTLYTNILYLKALKDMQVLSNIMGDTTSKTMFTNRYKEVYATFHQKFFTGLYFADWVDWKRQDYFASHANFLAIIYGIATKEEARTILAYGASHSMADFTLYNNHPKYPFWRIPVIQYIGGVPEYHNRGLLWLQPGITYALALSKVGKKTEAKEFLMKIASHVVRHNTVHEVYESSGLPVRRAIYTSEGPFAWSAGLFLWASHEIFGRER